MSEQKFEDASGNAVSADNGGFPAVWVLLPTEGKKLPLWRISEKDRDALLEGDELVFEK